MVTDGPLSTTGSKISLVVSVTDDTGNNFGEALYLENSDTILAIFRKFVYLIWYNFFLKVVDLISYCFR